MTEQETQFKEWAIVELFGHQRISGLVTQSQIADFLRVDVHVDVYDGVLYTRMINPKAIYAINPVSEEIARAVAKEYAQPPVQRYELRNLLAKGEEDSDMGF